MARHSFEKWEDPFKKAKSIQDRILEAEILEEAAQKVHWEAELKNNKSAHKVQGLNEADTKILRRVNAASEGDTSEMRTELRRQELLQEEARQLKALEAYYKKSGAQTEEEFLKEINS